jgi:AcrR family transcriptional regulator
MAPDVQVTPAESTREQLLDAAEALFLEGGLEDVSLRAIVRRAGQRNQSAMQYHFGRREDLIKAIIRRRMLQLECRRSKLVDDALARNTDLRLRDCCALLVSAPFRLCGERPDFRDMLGLTGSRLLSQDKHLYLLEEQSSPSFHRIAEILLGYLSELPREVLVLRIENAHGMALLAISRRARHRGSFRGPRAELFFNNLVDQVAATLASPVSSETLSALGDYKKM